MIRPGLARSSAAPSSPSPTGSTARPASGGTTSAGVRDYAQTWLSDAFEVAEVHVHPDHQGRGIGRAIVLALARPRLERTAVLSTQDADSPARRLYRRLGFSDLVTRFSFPGTDPPYAVMGAALPLREEPPLLAPGSPRR